MPTPVPAARRPPPAAGARSPEAMLALQRAIGNSAVGHLLSGRRPAPAVVQRFHLQKITQAGGAPPAFQAQSPEGRLSEQDGPGAFPWRIDHEITESTPTAGDPVQARVSDDFTLAVQDTTDEPKEFYATPQIVTTSNAALDATGSIVQLEQQTGSITVSDGTNGIQLGKVVPRRRDSPTPPGQAFASLTEDQCVRLAGRVIGIARGTNGEIVLGDGSQRYGYDGGRIAAVADRLSGSTDDDQLAAQLPQDQLPLPDDARTQAYGVSHGSDELTKAVELGVNQYAFPEVGEAFAIVSLGSERNTDYATPDGGAKTVKFPWNYHFAGVVARGTEGDSVTLENYTRSDSFEEAAQELYRKLVERYRQDTLALVRTWLHGDTYDTDDPRKTTEALRKLILREAKKAGVNGQAAFAALVSDAAKAERWFFRMYGQQTHQTFHEQQYASGANQIVNPVTVRIAKP